MNLLGALDLDLLRQVASGLMDGTLVAYRRERSRSTTGGQSLGTVTVGTFACRAVPRHIGARGGVAGGREEERQQWYIYVPAGTDIRAETDFVAVTNGGTFDVLGVHGPRAYEPSRRLICVERR